MSEPRRRLCRGCLTRHGPPRTQTAGRPCPSGFFTVPTSAYVVEQWVRAEVRTIPACGLDVVVFAARKEPTTIELNFVAPGQERRDD